MALKAQASEDRPGADAGGLNFVRSVAVTGANGFIGREVCTQFERSGIKVYRLQRTIVPDGTSIVWKLGDGLPDVCRNVDAVVHLASASLGETVSMAAAYEIDVAGSRKLIDDARDIRNSGRRFQFIFVSSQSARPNAPNVYGKSKWQIECLLDQGDEVIVRPGLVYSEPATGVFALFKKLATLPIAPVIVSQSAIQPIHVEDLAKCIVAISILRPSVRLFQLGEVKPLSFGQAIRASARQAGIRSPMLLPVPLALARFAATIIDTVFRPTPSVRERVDGLAGLQPMDTETSLRLLGVRLKVLGSNE